MISSNKDQYLRHAGHGTMAHGKVNVCRKWFNSKDNDGQAGGSSQETRIS